MVTKLLQGHSRFRQDYFQHERELFDALASGRHEPTALVISCSDARVVPNVILNADPGDLFVVRNIANLVPPFDDVTNRSVGAAIEYAVHALRVPHIVVCGHTCCGGLRALIGGMDPIAADMPTLALWLEDASALKRRLVSLRQDFDEAALERQLVMENVAVQLENLLTYPAVRLALDRGALELHGWVYSLEDGAVRVYDPVANAFTPWK